MCENANLFEYIIWKPADHRPAHPTVCSFTRHFSLKLLYFESESVCVCVCTLIDIAKHFVKIIFIRSISFWRASQRWLASLWTAAQFSIYFMESNIK